MPSNPYKTSVNQSKSVKRWARTIRNNDALGILSKFEMKRVNDKLRLMVLCYISQSLVQRHLRVLMCRESDTSLIPPSLSKVEKEGLMDRFHVGAELPQTSSIPLISVTDFVRTGVHIAARDFSEVELELMRWGVRRFSFDWEAEWDNRANALSREIFWNSFHRAIRYGSYQFTISSDILTREIILPVVERQFKRLALIYQDQCRNTEVVDYHYVIAEKKKLCKEYREYLVKCGASPPLASIFQPRNYPMFGDVVEATVIVGTHQVKELHFAIPQWWSQKAASYIECIEERVHFQATSREAVPGNTRPPHKFIVMSSTNFGFIPRHLPADLYSKKFKASLLPCEIAELKMKPSVLPEIENMSSIFTAFATEFDYHPLDGVVDDRYSSDDEESSDDISDSSSEIALDALAADAPEINHIEPCVQTQIVNLQADLQKSIAVFSDFQKELQDHMPARLEELEQAKNDINNINNKLQTFEGMLGSGEGARLSADTDQDSVPLPAASDIFPPSKDV
ncbi:uncharacterized protein MELLADRAFT_59731 [Melampsora larici-populina 98AG31]|uniref:Uncharacterized protein n=1 Tax=Melampsora larici-populina (strain 98AG31 / pathotype 3-4-7) TaxID=747676 RepID=F4R731_MELLP|nr:uncharacterized protein MELLADRAFT_59731 [Melampsora larici-populina 98AG31]EGG11508.1 hypothetical protein MELLADRAFT_59731 [Melampsora larici-populina 98AG31]